MLALARRSLLVKTTELLACKQTARQSFSDRHISPSVSKQLQDDRYLNRSSWIRQGAESAGIDENFPDYTVCVSMVKIDRPSSLGRFAVEQQSQKRLPNCVVQASNLAAARPSAVDCQRRRECYRTVAAGAGSAAVRGEGRPGVAGAGWPVTPGAGCRAMVIVWPVSKSESVQGWFGPLP